MVTSLRGWWCRWCRSFFCFMGTYVASWQSSRSPAPNPSTLFRGASRGTELLSPQSPDTFQGARPLDLPTLLGRGHPRGVANLSLEERALGARHPADGGRRIGTSAVRLSIPYLSTDFRLRTSIDDVIGKHPEVGQEPVSGVIHERAQVALGVFGSVQRRLAPRMRLVDSSRQPS